MGGSKLKKNIVLGLLFCILGVFPLSATNVSFLVIETGLHQESRVDQYSAMWENGLFDVFFENGYIASNAPMMRLFDRPDETFPSEAERDFENAKSGGMDYFIIAVINYQTPRGTAIARAQNVILRLFNTQSEQMLHEKNHTVTPARNERAEYENIKKAITEFAAYLMR